MIYRPILTMPHDLPSRHEQCKWWHIHLHDALSIAAEVTNNFDALYKKFIGFSTTKLTLFVSNNDVASFLFH